MFLVKTPWEKAVILFGRIKRKYPEKSGLLTGLRGAGKTVLRTYFPIGFFLHLRGKYAFRLCHYLCERHSRNSLIL